MAAVAAASCALQSQRTLRELRRAEPHEREKEGRRSSRPLTVLTLASSSQQPTKPPTRRRYQVDPRMRTKCRSCSEDKRKATARQMMERQLSFVLLQARPTRCTVTRHPNRWSPAAHSGTSAGKPRVAGRTESNAFEKAATCERARANSLTYQAHRTQNGVFKPPNE